MVGGYEPNGWMSFTDPPDPVFDTSDPVWNSIRRVLFRFMSFHPETGFGTYGEEIATRQGYLDKIRILYPGYILNPQTDQFLLRRPTLQQLEPHMAIDDLPDPSYVYH